jgi:RNA polymerase sigma-70 factor, ECF subfamily
MESNAAGWSDLVDLYYASIYRYCRQMLNSTSEAEDATQEVFIRVFKHLDSMRDPTARRGWIYSIARNLCRDKQRWWRRTAVLLQRHFSEEPVAEPRFESSLSTELQSAILALPVRQREVFVLRHFHDFSTAETAETLGINQGTVKSHLKRAVDSLRQTLTADMETTSEPSESSALIGKGM